MVGVYEIKLRVQFGDIDMENRLTLKGMLRLMQEAANRHSDEVGYGVNNIESTDYSWVLYQQHCRLYRRPCWNTELTLRTWSRGADGMICLRDFEALDGEGGLVAAATSGWLLVQASTQRMARIPQGMLEQYGTVERAVLDEPLHRLKMLSAAPKTWEYTVQRRDIDINRHVNNLCYLDYALEALPEGYGEESFNDVNIMYKKASFAGDRIACFAGWRDGDGTAVSEPAGNAADISGPEEDAVKKAAVPGVYVTSVKDSAGELLHAVVELSRC